MSSLKDHNEKNTRRLRRKLSLRKGVFGIASAPRLTVYRSHKNIYCQLIDDAKGVTLASASTSQKDARGVGELPGSGGNCKAASVVGQAIAQKAKSLGIERVRFDRNGYRFHGRVKALADAARGAGLKF